MPLFAVKLSDFSKVPLNIPFTLKLLCCRLISVLYIVNVWYFQSASKSSNKDSKDSKSSKDSKDDKKDAKDVGDGAHVDAVSIFICTWDLIVLVFKGCYLAACYCCCSAVYMWLEDNWHGSQCHLFSEFLSFEFLLAVFCIIYSIILLPEICDGISCTVVHSCRMAVLIQSTCFVGTFQWLFW